MPSGQYRKSVYNTGKLERTLWDRTAEHFMVIPQLMAYKIGIAIPLKDEVMEACS